MNKRRTRFAANQKAASLEDSIPQGTKRRTKGTADAVRSTINSARDSRVVLGRMKPSSVVTD